MSDKKSYKNCFVPKCESTTIKCPEKIFFFVPQKSDVRKKWFNLAHRADAPGTHNYWCCADHFDLKEDIESYTRYCLMGAPAKLKRDAVPHIFNCQPNRTWTHSQRERTALKKLSRKRLINEMLSENENENIRPNKIQCEVSSTSSTMCIKEILADTPNYNKKPAVSTVTTNSVKQVTITADLTEDNAVTEVNSNDKILKFGESSKEPLHNRIKKIKSTRSIGVQVMSTLVKPHVRSKGIMAIPSKSDGTCQTINEISISEKKNQIEVNPPKKLSSPKKSLTSSSSSYQPSSAQSTQESLTSGDSDFKNEKKNEMKQLAISLSNYFISLYAKKYIGVDNEWIGILNLLQSSTGLKMEDIKLTLMKIRLNDSFDRLANLFGISESQTSRIFNKSVKPLAFYLKTLVYCPKSIDIKMNLPIAFRANYSHVSAIIDAFEIEIEKPSDAVVQALTWSEYKKANTLKYLVACTPDGFIIFVPSGFGGRISDTVLFEESKLLNILNENSAIMADRGFKQIQTLLQQKNCELIRPPSVSTNVKPTKDEILQTKRIASLRIHVERVIRRFREYKILLPHACLDLQRIAHIDSIVQIVAGLINLQKPIIKQ